MTMDQEYISVKEVADLCGFSVRTVWRWVHLDRLKPDRITRTGRPRFRRDQVLRAMEQSRDESPPPQQDHSMG